MEQNFTVVLTNEEVIKIGQALAQLPYFQVTDLLAKLQYQINSQQEELTTEDKKLEED